ncbi:MAG: HlyD family secretion protein [Rubrimonas sp.]|uniref:HlyD family secretion protein n=1 Tax=Rubrimonas sp. TaxID=2036015 RepID=UPI002FDD26B3
MLELLICSLFTIFPDYLYRRYAQGKRFGREITLFSVWYELRLGISGCVILTVLLITAIFYFHPSTTSASSVFRTVPIVPEINGRVAEVFVTTSAAVEAGQPLLRLDDSVQQAALETAQRRIEEVEADASVATADLAAAQGGVRTAEASYRQALEELQNKQTLAQRNPDVVPRREIERLEEIVETRQGSVDSAVAAVEAVEARLAVQLPARRASAEAALQEAQTQLDKTVVRAGVSGRVEQFLLRVGDVVNPFMRPAGVLIPEDSGRQRIAAGFGQLEAQVIRTGMYAEAVCLSKPLTVIPLVITAVQTVIADGQLRTADQLVDVAALRAPGTVLAALEPLHPDGMEGVPPGSRCIVNAYTSNHDRLSDPDLGFGTRLVLHAVDTIGIVHAILLRSQALLLPIRTLVLGGH